MSARWWPETREGDLVACLSDDEHRRLMEALEPESVAAGDLVLRKGEPSQSLVLVEEGELEVVDESLGQTLVLALVGAGGVVGEVGLVDGRPRTHSVRARRDCRLRRLDKERLSALESSAPLVFAKLAMAMAELIALRFRGAIDELSPVRAFASSLREPLEAGDAVLAPAEAEGGEGDGFDEIDDVLPPGSPEEVAEALERLRGIRKRAGRGLGGV